METGSASPRLLALRAKPVLRDRKVSRDLRVILALRATPEQLVRKALKEILEIQAPKALRVIKVIPENKDLKEKPVLKATLEQQA